MSTSNKNSSAITYEKAGVNIRNADETKRLMAESLKSQSSRVLNKFGAFGSVIDGVFKEYKHPVLVLKMEEPGSKQLLAAQHGRLPKVAYDLVNHLINDVIVMGAKPVAILDTIVCGKLEKEVVVQLVREFAEACKAQQCDLVGGETSEQPRVLPPGSYVLSAAAVGVADKEKIVDGKKIKVGDSVVAIASNGVHTNGYTLVRSLLDADKGLEKKEIAPGLTFLDAVLEPHLCYNHGIQKLLEAVDVRGLAHITGGGLEGNLNRVLPEGVDALIDLSKIEILPVFKAIRTASGAPDSDLLHSLNLGVGMTAVVSPTDVEATITSLEKSGHKAYEIGAIVEGDKVVQFKNTLRW